MITFPPEIPLFELPGASVDTCKYLGIGAVRWKAGDTGVQPAMLAVEGIVAHTHGSLFVLPPPAQVDWGSAFGGSVTALHGKPGIRYYLVRWTAHCNVDQPITWLTSNWGTVLTAALRPDYGYQTVDYVYGWKPGAGSDPNPSAPYQMSATRDLGVLTLENTDVYIEDVWCQYSFYLLQYYEVPVR